LTSDFWAENEEIKIVGTAKVMDSVALPFGFASLVESQRQKTNAEERKDERKGTQRRTQGRRKRNGGFSPLHHSRCQVVVVGWFLDVILRFFGGAYLLSV
jgi:hypothetical protein